MDIFKGKLFNIDGHGYFRCGRKRVHRIIWEHYNGSIPKGFDIHHKDGNKFNNDISNLECICHKKHLSMHMKANSIKIHAWLKTVKGYKFLSEKAKRQWKEMPLKTFTCQNCSKEFQTKHNRFVKYCGDNCVMSARNKSGVDNIDRTCVICSNSFVINRYQKTQTCSFNCRNKLISLRKMK